MKRLLTILIGLALTFGMVGLAEASDTISFADSIQGVDSPQPSWSGGNDMALLGTSHLSLLSGMATLDGSSTLTHRLTRGLGVYGVVDDEVDGSETIVITFPSLNYYVDYLEVRSLFTGEQGGAEVGAVDFYLDGSIVHTESLSGSPSGVVGVTYSTPQLVDKLVFYVPAGDEAWFSEFAVAKLEVTQGLIYVDIDIKPGSDPNPINPGSNGLVPVAILGSPEFDATSVDPKTVKLGGASVAVRGKNKLMAHEEDVNGDGLIDLVVQVDTEAAGLWTSGTVILTATTYDNQDIIGSDEVVIVPPE